MAIAVNWSRQIMILVMAAVFAVYWTGKQGLWDALRGSSPLDRDWGDAKQALVRRLPPKYEVIDGLNQHLEKRVLVLAPPPQAAKEVASATDEKEIQPLPQTIAAELIPIIRDRTRGRKGKKFDNTRERERERFGKEKKTFGKEARTKDKGGFGQKQDKRDRRGGKRGRKEEPEKLPIAKLRIHDPALNFLKEMFGSNAIMHHDSLIQAREEEEDGMEKADRGNAASGGRAHHHSEF